MFRAVAQAASSTCDVSALLLQMHALHGVSIHIIGAVKKRNAERSSQPSGMHHYAPHPLLPSSFALLALLVPVEGARVML